MSTWSCTHCGRTPREPTDTFCEQCGHKLPQPIEGVLAFCESCDGGAPIALVGVGTVEMICEFGHALACFWNENHGVELDKEGLERALKTMYAPREKPDGSAD